MACDDTSSICPAYLYVCRSEMTVLAPETVFYQASNEPLAKSLCRVFTAEHAGAEGATAFQYQTATALAPEVQVLLDEALELLDVYDDPDPGVYDPPPSRDIILRAQYACRARKLEQLLNDRTARSRKKNEQNVIGTGRVNSQTRSVEEALAVLQHAVEKHRLAFLFFARPMRRNPANRSDPWDAMPQRDLPNGRIPTEAIDVDGEFLFKYRWVLDSFAQAAVSRYGCGTGVKPSLVGQDGSRVELEDSSFPLWCVDEIACLHLQELSDQIINVSKTLAKMDVGRRFHPLIQKVRKATHDEGQSRWYSSVLIRWEYLATLDNAIAAVKAADLDYQDVDAKADSRTAARSAKQTAATEDSSIKAGVLARKKALGF